MPDDAIRLVCQHSCRAGAASLALTCKRLHQELRKVHTVLILPWDRLRWAVRSPALRQHAIEDLTVPGGDALDFESDPGLVETLDLQLQTVIRR